MFIVTILDTHGACADRESLVDSAGLFNPLCQALAAIGSRVLLIDANPIPMLSSSPNLVLRARHGLLRSLVRGVVKQDSVSQFSRSPKLPRRRKKGYLHLLRAIRCDSEERDLPNWLTKKPDAIRLLLRNLAQQNAYDHVLIDARYASEPVRNAAVFASHLAAMPMPDTMAAASWSGRLIPLRPVQAEMPPAAHSDATALPRTVRRAKLIPPPKLVDQRCQTYLQEVLHRVPAWSYHGAASAGEYVPCDENSTLLDLDDDVAWRAGRRAPNPAPQTLATPILTRNVFELPNVLLDEPVSAVPEDFVAWIKRCARASRLVRERLNNLLPDYVRVWMPNAYRLVPGLQLRAFVTARPAQNVRRRAVSRSRRTTHKGGAYAAAMAL